MSGGPDSNEEKKDETMTLLPSSSCDCGEVGWVPQAGWVADRSPSSKRLKIRRCEESPEPEEFTANCDECDSYTEPLPFWLQPFDPDAEDEDDISMGGDSGIMFMGDDSYDAEDEDDISMGDDSGIMGDETEDEPEDSKDDSGIVGYDPSPTHHKALKAHHGHHGGVLVRPLSLWPEDFGLASKLEY
jgi:hypothetical protein